MAHRMHPVALHWAIRACGWKLMIAVLQSVAIATGASSLSAGQLIADNSWVHILPAL
jgi:hypothetical protein